MPVLILRDRCDNLAHCYAATACPKQALFYDEASGQVVVFPERCADCRGPCLNFCDRYALRYAPSLEELRLLQAELDGSMSAEEIARQRMLLRQAAEARRREQLQEVTAANFQQEVLQARLPVLLVVDSARLPTWKRLGAALEQVVGQFMGQLLVRRINSDVELQLTGALRVRSVPTFILVHEGQIVDGVEGEMSPTRLQSWLQGVLAQLQPREQAAAKGTPPARAGEGIFRKG